MVLAKIILMLEDRSTVEVYYYTHCLWLCFSAAWGSSDEIIHWGEYPELTDIWNEGCWNLAMLTNLCEQFDFSEVM